MESPEPCVFCRIVAKELPAKVVYEDSKSIAILNIHPISPGHLLVIPKEHYKTITDMPESLYKHLAGVVWKLSLRIQEALDPDGLNIVQNNNVQAGQAVPHFHIHLIPRFLGDEENYKEWKEMKVSDDDLKKTEELLKNRNL